MSDQIAGGTGAAVTVDLIIRPGYTSFRALIRRAGRNRIRLWFPERLAPGTAVALLVPTMGRGPLRNRRPLHSHYRMKAIFPKAQINTQGGRHAEGHRGRPATGRSPRR
jgi:hypothetical protein